MDRSLTPNPTEILVSVQYTEHRLQFCDWWSPRGSFFFSCSLELCSLDAALSGPLSLQEGARGFQGRDRVLWQHVLGKLPGWRASGSLQHGYAGKAVVQRNWQSCWEAQLAVMLQTTTGSHPGKRNWLAAYGEPVALPSMTALPEPGCAWFWLTHENLAQGPRESHSGCSRVQPLECRRLPWRAAYISWLSSGACAPLAGPRCLCTSAWAPLYAPLPVLLWLAPLNVPPCLCSSDDCRFLAVALGLWPLACGPLAMAFWLCVTLGLWLPGASYCGG